MATTITKETLQPQQGTSASSMAEDESLKRNTDCVYFLASPLTCKKGNECEYRHSEYARMNPRDCWYWMNGNCLNPKCSFRHPPLDGLVSPQAGNFAGPPAIVQPGPPVPAAPQNPTKQGVPCIFFQKGYCLKGDRCPFMHGPNPTTTKMQQVSASNAAPEAPAFKKNFGSLEKCTQPKMNCNVNTPKVVEAPPQSKAIPKVQSSRPVNGEPSGRGFQPPHVFEEASKYKEMKPFSVDNGRSRSGHAHHGGSYDDHSFQNGRDADESLRESSPGFDVLVDDKLSEDENYPDDQYSRMRGHDRRNPKEFDMGHQDEYYPAADVDSETYHNRHGYDSFDRVPDKYGWDHRRASSERSLGESAHYDRRGPFKSESQSPDLNQNSDLRYRLSKQRRVNGLKSVVTSDYGFDDHHSEDRDYRSARRDSRRSPVHETSRGNRLHGRIKLPRRPSPMNGNDMDPDRETERGRNWGRLSPSRQQVSGLQGRLRDRLGGRIQDETRDGRRINGPMASQVAIAGADFAAPKRLSELRGSQQSDSKQQQLKSQQSVTGGKLKDTVLASSIATEGDLSFEGPKPLSEILKRKRTTPTGINSNNKEEIKRNENNVNSAPNSVKHVTLSSAIEQDEASEVYNKPLAVEADEEGEILNKKTKLDGESEFLLPEPDDNKHPEAEEDLAAVVGEEAEYDEEYEQGEDGDCDYEQDGGFNLNEGETGDQEVDSMDEDDGDDFAKKLGVSF